MNNYVNISRHEVGLIMDLDTDFYRSKCNNSIQNPEPQAFQS